MTKIKLCGLTRPEDIAAANAVHPDFVGFVFAPKSKRYLAPEAAGLLKTRLAPGIRAVGVFVNEAPETVADLLNRGVIDIAQLHGQEDTAYLARLRALTDKPLWQAFRVDGPESLTNAAQSPADLLLLDSGAGGTGTAFDWTLLQDFSRPYLLAGGLDPATVGRAVRTLHPYGVDVSSGIETNGRKNPEKMAAFAAAVRDAERKKTL